MQFKLTLTTYYEALFRELAIIRPVRMMSPLVLPSLADNELSHNRFRCTGPPPRTDESCFPRGDPSRLSDTCTGSGCNFPFPWGCDHSKGECYVMRGMKAPIGTGPYQVISKTLSSGEIVPASSMIVQGFGIIISIMRGHAPVALGGRGQFSTSRRGFRSLPPVSASNASICSGLIRTEASTWLRS